MSQLSESNVNLLLAIVALQSAVGFVIVVFVVLKLGEVLSRLKKLTKDIDEVWKRHRFFKGMIQGSHNRLIVKIERKFKELDVHTDFSSEMYSGDDQD